MGIPLTNVPVSDACPLCFDANQTPINLYVSITGVMRGLTWAPSLGPAPNGAWQLGNATGCSWGTTIDGWAYEYSVLPGSSTFSVTKPFQPSKFLHVTGTPCELFFVNSITSTISPFYGGIASITTVMPGWEPDIQNVADKMNIAADPATFAEFFPIAEDVNVFRFAAKKDATNVKIKFDNS